MRKYIFILIIFIVTLGYSLQTYAQCTIGTKNGGALTAPTTSWQSKAITSAYYYSFTATAGNIYDFSLCTGDGSAACTWDSQITIFDNAGTYANGYNDDFCSTQSHATWTAPSTATYKVLISLYNCQAVTTSTATMAYKYTNPIVNYYSKSTGNLNLVTSWGTNTDGSGTNPVNFTTNYQIFNIRNNASPTVGASWTVSGTSSQVIVGDGTNACIFTLPSAYTYSSPITDINNGAVFKNQNVAVTSLGTCTVNSGGTYQHDVNGGTIPTATWNSGSTCKVTGIINPASIGGYQTFHHFIWDNPSQVTTIWSLPATINGDFTLANGMVYVAASSGAAGFTVGGNFNMTGGTFEIGIGSSIGTLTVNGNFTISNGTFTHQRAATTGVPVFNLKGNWSNNGGTYTPGTQTTSLNGTLNQSLGGSNATSFYGLSLSNAGGATLANSITVGGTLTLSSGTFTVGAYTLTLNGPTTAGTPSNLSTTSSSNLIFGGSSASVVMPSSATALNNLTINNSNGVSLSGSPTISGTLTLTSGALIIGAYTLSLNGLISYGSGTLTGGGSSNITFGGSGATTTLNAVTLNNLTINRANGITLGAAVIVGGTFTLTNGLLNTTATNILNITNTAVAAISGGSASSYVNGPITRKLLSIAADGTNYSFPVGESGNYRPLDMVNIRTASTPVVQVTLSGTGASTFDGTLASVAPRNWYCQTLSGTFTSTTIKLTESGLGSLSRVASSAAQSGTYTTQGGTVGSGVITSNTGQTFAKYFAIGAIPGPTVTSCNPSSFFKDKGVVNVVLTGTNLSAATAVSMGGIAASSYTVNSATQITATFLAGTYPTNTLSVTTAAGTGTSDLALTANTRNIIPVGGGVDNHTTIKSALDGLYAWMTNTAFTSDITIEVYNGTYNTSMTTGIVVPNTLLNPQSGAKLIIQNHSGDSPVINATGLANGFNISVIDNVKIDGFTVYAATSGANINADGSNIEICNNKCYSSSAGSGIKLSNSTGTASSIHNNLCYSNATYGIHNLNSNSTSIKNNTCYDNGGTVSGTLTKTYSGASVGITDNSCASTTSVQVINVAESYTITDVNVKVIGISHLYVGDLTLFVKGPDATEVILSNRNGVGGGNYVNTVFDDEGVTAISAGSAPYTGTFIPDNSLTAFDTKNTNGNWTFRVTDCAASDVGSINANGWEITFAYSTTTGAGLYVESGTSVISANNILIGKSGGAYYATKVDNNGLSTSSGWNTQYALGSKFCYYNAAEKVDLTSWNTSAWSSSNDDINSDPLLVNIGTDFHEKSTTGSYHGGSWPPSVEAGGTWTADASLSPVVDAGNADAYANEPACNGAVINQGCYGNTPQASKGSGPTPVATAATAITGTSFSANWTAVSGAVTYYLDVDDNSDFSSPITNYDNLNVGNVITYPVNNISTGTTFYYRVRVEKACVGPNSNTITIKTLKYYFPVGSGQEYASILAATDDMYAIWGSTAFDGVVTLEVFAGTYNESINPNTALNPSSTYGLVFKSHYGDVVIIDGQSTRTQGVNINAIDYVTVSGFTVRNNTVDGIKVVGGNCIVENNIVYANGSAGAGTNICVLGGGNNNNVRYNKCYGDGSKPETGIRIYQSNTDSVHHNLVYSHQKYGIWIQESGTNLVIHNTAYDNGSSTASAATLQFSEYFASGIPVSWSQLQTGGHITQSVLWRASASQCKSPARTISASVSGAYAIVDADCNGASGMARGTSTLTTTTYNLTGKTSCHLKLSHYFYSFGSDTAYIQMNVGAGWTTVATYTASTANAQSEDFAISSADNKASVQFRFRYGADWDWYWAIDNFEIWGTGGAGVATGVGIYATTVGAVTVTLTNNNLVAKAASGDSYYALQSGASVTVATTYNNFYNNGNTNFTNINNTKDNAIGTYNTRGWGANNISGDPIFVNAASGDFHEQSQAGSFHSGEWPPLTAASGTWVLDNQNSPVLDVGTGTVTIEPSPNGSKINMGCYGNTLQASKSSGKDSKVKSPASQVAAGNIASIVNGSGSAVSVFRFTIEDLGASGFNDGLSTMVTKFVIQNNGGTADWTNHIAGALLWDDAGGAEIANLSVSITDNDITFIKTSGSFDVSNGSTKDITLKIWLNTSNIVDNATMLFKIPRTSHNFISDITGTQFNSDFGTDVVSNTTTVTVTATQLAFVQQPSNLCTGSSMSPAVTVIATDMNGNYDKTALSISITAAGATLTGSPVSQNTSNGTATFSTLTFTITGASVTLTAAASGCSSVGSNVFVVTTTPSAPTATAATGVGTNYFNANWTAQFNATYYLLDVSTVNTFASFVGSYNNLNVGNVTSYPVTGLIASTTYYFRVRAYNSCGTSPSSNTISVATLEVLLGANVSGNFINNGTFSQANDANFLLMTGISKEIQGTGDYDSVKIRMPINSNIKFNGGMSNGTMCSKLKIDLSANFTVATTAATAFRTKSMNNIGTLTLETSSFMECGTNWTNTGTVSAHAQSTVTFTGAVQQYIITGSTHAVPQSFGHVVFNNTLGNASWDIKTYRMSVAADATFANGIVVYNNTTNDTLVFIDGATVLGNAGSATSFVDGIVQKRGKDDFIFPLGNIRAGIKAWAPIKIANATLGSSSDVFSATYTFNSVNTVLGIANWTGMGSGLDHASGIEYWNLVRKATTSSVPAVTLYWKDGARSAIGTGASPLAADYQDITIAHWNGSSWDNMCSSVTATGSNASGSVYSNVAFTSYSPITFGSKSSKNPLPVDVTSFIAQCENSSIQLDWATASETNNSHFMIEKSFDGLTWFEVAKVTGSGNSNVQQKYQYLDKADLLNKTIYYRLTQVDFDGVTKTYNAIATSCQDNMVQESYVVYPNPAKDALYISIQSSKSLKGVLSVTNELGQKINVENLLLEKGSNDYSINTSNFAIGVYYISIISDSNSFPVKRFVISK